MIASALFEDVVTKEEKRFMKLMADTCMSLLNESNCFGTQAQKHFNPFWRKAQTISLRFLIISQEFIQYDPNE